MKDVCEIQGSQTNEIMSFLQTHAQRVAQKFEIIFSPIGFYHLLALSMHNRSMNSIMIDEQEITDLTSQNGNDDTRNLLS